MGKLKCDLEKAGVIRYCTDIGISVVEIFLDNNVEIENKGYETCVWSVRENPTDNLRGGKVVYAVPKEKIDFWEAWYIIGEKFYHRVLSLSKGKKCDGFVEIDINDKYHPEATLGEKWYYYDVDFTIPLRLRKQKKEEQKC